MRGPWGGRGGSTPLEVRSAMIFGYFTPRTTTESPTIRNRPFLLRRPWSSRVQLIAIGIFQRLTQLPLPTKGRPADTPRATRSW
jgi:hypothetical protein